MQYSQTRQQQMVICHTCAGSEEENQNLTQSASVCIVKYAVDIQVLSFLQKVIKNFIHGQLRGSLEMFIATQGSKTLILLGEVHSLTRT